MNFEGMPEGFDRGEDVSYEDILSDPELYEKKQDLQRQALEKFAEWHSERDRETSAMIWATEGPAKQFDEYLQLHPEIIKEYENNPHAVAEEILLEIEERGEE